MGQPFYYDMTTYDSNKKSLAQFTGVSEDDIENYILNNSNDFSTNHFLSEFGIDENQLLHNDLWLTSLHVTTNNDECEAIAYSANPWTVIPKSRGHLIRKLLDSNSVNSWTPIPESLGQDY